MKKTIIGITIISVIASAGYYLSIKGNNIARSLFMDKYSQEKEHILKAEKDIQTRVFSEKQKQDYNNFIETSLNYDYMNIVPIKTISEVEYIDFNSMDNDSFYNSVKDKNQIQDFNKIIEGGVFLEINDREINNQIPSFQWFNEASMLNYALLLKEIRNGKDISLEFKELQEDRLRHLAKTNLFIYNLILLDQLGNDISFAEYVKNKYNINLEIRELKEEEYSIKETFDSELELSFSVVYGLPTKEDENYMKEAFYQYNNKLKEIFKTDINKKVDVENVDFNIQEGYVEKYGSPIANILIETARPINQTYRNDFYEYNERVKEYNKNL